MSKDPAVLFYTSDFLTGVLFFSDEEIGKYIKLLCMQHQKGHLSEEDMLHICKTYDKKIFEKFKKDNNELYYNERMDKEIIKRKSYSESRRTNRIGKKENIQEHMSNISSTYVEHMENENENINISEINSLGKCENPFTLFALWGKPNPNLSDQQTVENLIKTFEYKKVESAFRKASEQGEKKCNLAYVRGILNNNGVKRNGTCINQIEPEKTFTPTSQTMKDILSGKIKEHTR